MRIAQETPAHTQDHRPVSRHQRREGGLAGLSLFAPRTARATGRRSSPQPSPPQRGCGSPEGTRSILRSPWPKSPANNRSAIYFPSTVIPISISLNSGHSSSLAFLSLPSFPIPRNALTAFLEKRIKRGGFKVHGGVADDRDLLKWAEIGEFQPRHGHTARAFRFDETAPA